MYVCIFIYLSFSVSLHLYLSLHPRILCTLLPIEVIIQITNSDNQIVSRLECHAFRANVLRTMTLAPSRLWHWHRLVIGASNASL